MGAALLNSQPAANTTAINTTADRVKTIFALRFI
jgi:hypothetical protein